jgi:methionyl-tRNA formyltransferase
MTKKKILFMGRKKVAAKCLDFLAHREDVEIVGVLTDSHLAVSPTTDIAKKYGFKIFDFDSALKSIEDESLHFDLGLSMLYWRKLKGGFLTVPKNGVINFHPAPLPEYKGTAGYNLAILDGLKKWAVTAHYVDESIDTGKIIETNYFDIDYDNETAQSLERTSQDFLSAQFNRVVECALNQEGLLPSIDNEGGRYVSRLEMEMMKEVKPTDDVSRKIRAFWFPPYDGAYMMVNGVKCTLVDRKILDGLSDGSNSSLFTQKSE